MTGKLLLKLDTVKFIVANHTVLLAEDMFLVPYLSELKLCYILYSSHLKVFLQPEIVEGAVSFLGRIQMFSQ